MHEFKNIIESTYEKKHLININNINHDVFKSIIHIIKLLNNGIIRVAEKKNNIWITHTWLKKAILLYIYLKENNFIKGSHTNYYDKIPLKYEKYDEKKFQQEQIRIVPPATIRYGFIY